VLPIAHPYRTVSGTVTKAIGQPPGFFTIRVSNRKGNDFIAYTDAGGNYSVDLDTQGVLANNGAIRVNIDELVPGYAPFPPGYGYDTTVASGSLTGINFQFVEILASGISGTLANSSSKNVVRYVVEAIAGGDTLRAVFTGGAYVFAGLPAGGYSIRAAAAVDSPSNWKLIKVYPGTVTVLANDTTIGINFTFTDADTIGGNRTAVKTIAPVFSLASPSPNPFNPSVTLRYAVASRTPVQLRVFDLSGRMVQELVSQVQAPGYYQAVWNGKDRLNRPAASGVYICRLQAGRWIAQRTMLLMK
jgi:hypothetical protein